MRKDTTGEADVIRLRQDISSLLRRRVLEAVESVLEEELSEALGTGRYERSEERRGYRNVSDQRTHVSASRPGVILPASRTKEDQDGEEWIWEGGTDAEDARAPGRGEGL